jgi:hypothetical protein
VASRHRSQVDRSMILWALACLMGMVAAFQLTSHMITDRPVLTRLVYEQR